MSRVQGRRCRGTSPGFTLIEVLAALVIVALGMLGAIEAVNQSTRNATYLREKSLAHWIAMNIVTERRLQPDRPSGEQTGELDFAGERWHWTLAVKQTAVQTMTRMDVAVRRASSADGTALATVSGFYGTAIGAAGSGSLTWAGSDTPGADGQANQEDLERERDKGRDDPSRPPRPPREPVDE